MPDLIRCQIDVPDADAQTAVQPVFVNGSKFPIEINTPILLSKAALEALEASTLTVRLLPAREGAPPAEGADAGAADSPGGADGGAEPAAKSDPLDHDGDGKKGGSKKGAASTRAKGAKKAKAKPAAKSKE